MEKNDYNKRADLARKARQQQIVAIAESLIDQDLIENFDPIHSPLCAIDVVIIAGAPWLKEALEKDYIKDESGYKKIGGGANNPSKNYFYRSSANLIHFFKRQGLYIPRGGKIQPAIGMVCFFEWDDRGRFNFSPDRSGIIAKVNDNNKIISVIVATTSSNNNFVVQKIDISQNPSMQKAIIGYSDLP